MLLWFCFIYLYIMYLSFIVTSLYRHSFFFITYGDFSVEVWVFEHHLLVRRQHKRSGFVCRHGLATDVTHDIDQRRDELAATGGAGTVRQVKGVL